MTVPTLNAWQGTIDGLLVGDGTPYDVAAISGLSEFPSMRTNDTPFPTGDGESTGDDYADGRTITLELEVMADAGTSYRDALAALRWACRPKRTVDFWFLLPTWDAPRRCAVRVRRESIPTDMQFEMGLATATFQLRAGDGVLYESGGDISTAFPQLVGGLRYDLYTDGAGAVTGWLDYGVPSSTGRLVLANSGTAAVQPVYRITGPVPSEGFELVLVGTGQRIRFEGPVADGSTLVIDSSDGSAMVDGVADRGGQLTYRDWWEVGPREQVEVAFVSLGATTGAQLVVANDSGWW